MSQASTSDGVQETLSAAMDGEATVDELHGALDAASGDDALRAKWERMHFASAVMRGALTTSATPSASIPLAARLGRRVAKPSRRPRLRLGPSVAAVVAVLAALTVVLVAGLMQEGESPNLVADRQAPPAAAPTATTATDLQPSVPVVELAPIDRRRMNAYMLQHARYNAAAGTAGIPLARVLGDATTAESEGE